MSTSTPENDPAARATVHWPALTADDAPEEFAALHAWVARLRIRFPNAVRLPDCWWRHNDLVEVLSALRDFERFAFAPGSPPTTPIEWHRALRDMEVRIEIWTKKSSCAVSDRGHAVALVDDGLPDGWDEFVDQDVRRRSSHDAPSG